MEDHRYGHWPVLWPARLYLSLMCTYSIQRLQNLQIAPSMSKCLGAMEAACSMPH